MWSCKKDSIEKKNNYGQIQKINNNFILSFVDSLFAWLVVLTARNFLLKASEFVEQRWKQKRLRVISEQTSFRRLFYDDDEKISLQSQNIELPRILPGSSGHHFSPWCPVIRSQLWWCRWVTPSSLPFFLAKHFPESVDIC